MWKIFFYNNSSVFSLSQWKLKTLHTTFNSLSFYLLNQSTDSICNSVFLGDDIGFSAWGYSFSEVCRLGTCFPSHLFKINWYVDLVVSTGGDGAVFCSPAYNGWFYSCSRCEFWSHACWRGLFNVGLTFF